jgi:hypothetical protein
MEKDIYTGHYYLPIRLITISRDSESGTWRLTPGICVDPCQDI